MRSILEHRMEDYKRMVRRAELARRLLEARERSGLSQVWVAGELGLPRSAVSKMENGEQRVESVVLADMARLYGVPVSSLLAEETAAFDGGDSAEALLRSAGGVFREDREVLEEFLRMCRDYAELRRMLGGALGN